MKDSVGAAADAGKGEETKMDDESLAQFLCPDDVPLGLRIVAEMPPEKRAGYERLSEVFNEIQLWQAGLGPKPTGVILCGPKQIRGARERREHKTADYTPPASELIGETGGEG